ncbi:DUF1801 domain-containing protein [Fluviicola chungangensis]|uniref:DUF1801 domain-containing protein n=1 Tax=Fluviicola chungangensis TaxID=2597671 RepID=A0A556N779_9FLAO|nr:DUF1801 domain-containing protein [Fluviicola chungangensis]TSJ47933.1 DUF1801 domain-containing protein [Fluviicola chungangensis]
MAKTKTAETTKDVNEFILEFTDSEQKRKDSQELIGLMEKVSGFKAKMWGPSIIGFGTYHYKYASGHEGDAPLLGFSPRKAAISLYVSTGEHGQEELLKDLGKFTMGKACIYVKKLSDINQDCLVKLMKDTVARTTKKYST